MDAWVWPVVPWLVPGAGGADGGALDAGAGDGRRVSVRVVLPVEEFVSAAGAADAGALEVATPELAALEAVVVDPAAAVEGWLLEGGTGGAAGVSGCGNRTSGCWVVLLPPGAIDRKSVV